MKNLHIFPYLISFKSYLNIIIPMEAFISGSHSFDRIGIFCCNLFFPTKFKGTVMQTEKAITNDRLDVSIIP